MNKLTKCPVCTYDEQFSAEMDVNDTFHIKCYRCKSFSITRTALLKLPDKVENHRLCAWIRSMAEDGRSAPSFDSRSLSVVLKNLPSYSPVEKQLILLRQLMRMTSCPGDKLLLAPHIDYPLAWASNENEFNYYVKALHERKLIEKLDGGEYETEFPHEIRISSKGWEFIESHELLPAFNDQVFIAMSFSDALNDAWELGIKYAVEKAGYRPYRIDKDPHNERIDAKIIAEIKNSQFLIVDVTEQKQGVYYEAGFAQGLNRQVLWSVREDDLDNVHFDTRQFGHVVWKDIEDLQEKLYEMICAVVGKNPNQTRTIEETDGS